nr:MAG TPA: hypothetical protein [Crassvirales sp.]
MFILSNINIMSNEVLIVIVIIAGIVLYCWEESASNK